VLADFGHLREVAVHRALYGAEFGLQGAPRAGFFPILPSGGGLHVLLWGHYLDQPMAAWFAPVDPRRSPMRYRLATQAVLLAIRAAGGHAVQPRYVPLADVAPVARWLADCKAAGRPALLSGYASTCARVCQAAAGLGLDIAGSAFSMVGEPVTRAKRDAVRSVGGIPIACYASVEAGFLANACARSEGPDDMHFFTDSFALIRHRRRVPPFGVEVEPFLVTTLLPHAPLVLLNVELDDHGDVSEQPCDCVWGRLGLTLRVSNVRSFAKLTSEGMTFVGSNLVEVLERELPERFGGAAGDYQILEGEDAGGRPRLTLRIRPAVGPVSDAEVLEFLYRTIRSGDGARRLSGDLWAEGRTLQVERADPLETPGGKVLAFHTQRPAERGPRQPGDVR
jgi:hypothetical protein